MKNYFDKIEKNIVNEGVQTINIKELSQKTLATVKILLGKYKGLHLKQTEPIYKYKTKLGKIAYAIGVDLSLTNDLTINFDFNKTYPEVNSFFVKNKSLYISILDPDTMEVDKQEQTVNQLSFNA